MKPANQPKRPGGAFFPRKRRRIRLWIAAVVFLIFSGIPATAGGVEDYLRDELLGCQAVLRSNVMRVDFEPTYEMFGDLPDEIPVATWVNEEGTVHNIAIEPGSGLRNLKTQLLEGDKIRIVGLTSNRRSTQLVLSLASNPDIHSRLELRYSGSLRKNLSDVDRVWTVLGQVMELSPAATGEGICRKDATETEGSDHGKETPGGQPAGGEYPSDYPGGRFGLDPGEG